MFQLTYTGIFINKQWVFKVKNMGRHKKKLKPRSFNTTKHFEKIQILTKNKYLCKKKSPCTYIKFIFLYVYYFIIKF